MGTEKFTTGPGSVGDFPTTDAATGTHRIATAFLPHSRRSPLERYFHYVKLDIQKSRHAFQVVFSIFYDIETLEIQTRDPGRSVLKLQFHRRVVMNL